MKTMVPFGFRFITLSLALWLTSVAHADHYLKDTHSPLPIVLTQALSSDQNHTGDLFEGTLAEDTLYQGKTIPGRTAFYGHIASAGQGKRFYRKGYLALNVDQVTFPGGESLHFITDDPNDTEKKLKQTTPGSKRNLYIKVPLTVLGLVTPFPVTMGVKAAVGVTTAFTDKNHKDDSAVKKVGVGLYNATPIPTVVNFVKKQPNVTFQAGDTILLYLPENIMTALFSPPESLNQSLTTGEPPISQGQAVSVFAETSP